MRQDIFGQTITTASPEAASAWDATQMAFLAHAAATPDHLARTIAADPGFAIAHATKGLFLMLLGRREFVATAQEALAAARASVARLPVTAREAEYVAALCAWLRGRPSEAVARMEAVLARHPRDTMAMKVSHAIRFVLGDAEGMRRSTTALLPAHGEDHPARGYMLGCHAFALEETGDYARAERTGRRGMEISPDDAWGLHAVAHVYEMTGDSRGGLGWLSGREQAWAHCNNFRFHVWWHKALMHLNEGETDAVLSLYDTAIRAEKTDDYRDISNATSLLMRLELEGVDVGERWEELADLSAKRTEDGRLIFADLHYLLALIGAGRTEAIRRLLGRIARDARTQGCEMQIRMGRPGISLAAGLDAFGEGAYRTAFLNLSRARRDRHLVGGSIAQRDVFERLTIDAGLRAGFLDEAEAILDDRSARWAGRDDTYAEARRGLIAEARGAEDSARAVPAE